MEPNFELTTNTKTVLGVKLFQIKAKQDIPSKGVKKGDLGGWVEKEKTSSGEAVVYGDAWVYGDACVSGEAVVSGEARVYGNAWVYGEARVSGKARVSAGWLWASVEISKTKYVKLAIKLQKELQEKFKKEIEQ